MSEDKRQPESDAIRQARQDVNDRAAELQQAQLTIQRLGEKLRAAQDRLTKLLEKANAKK